MNGLRIPSLVQSERFARQVKAINYTASRIIAFLLAALALQQMSAPVAQAGEPALPKLKTETQGAFERYLKLAEVRNEGELRRGTHLLWVDGLPEEQRAEAYGVLNTEHEVQCFQDAPGRAHSRSSAVRIAEVVNAGKSDEREKTPGNDDGFMWRMETWWRMEERDGGVYVQSEVASLTRDIPTGLGWMIKPFVTGIPKESLTFTLEATRKAVEAHRLGR